jgi:uncharacterized protein
MKTKLQQVQAQFAAYIRDPEHHQPPSGAAPQRMAVYRELFFNNVQSFLSGNFPVLFTLYDDEQAAALMQDFYLRHSCRTPYFSEIAEEFLDYLANERQQSGDFAFLWELAHYEWVEMALAIADAPYRQGDAAFIADVLNRPLALSPLAAVLAYRYPVERICREFLPEQEQPSFLVVYRDAEDEVKFMQTTELTWRLLTIIEQSGSLAGREAISQLIGEQAAISQAQAEQFALPILQELAGKGIVVPG